MSECDLPSPLSSFRLSFETRLLCVSGFLSFDSSSAVSRRLRLVLLELKDPRMEFEARLRSSSSEEMAQSESSS